MKTPIEIAEEAIADTHDLGVRDIHYARAVIRAIEAAGFVIAHPDQEEIGMVFDSVFELPPPDPRPTIEQIRAALRAAPKWSEKP